MQRTENNAKDKNAQLGNMLKEWYESYSENQTGTGEGSGVTADNDAPLLWSASNERHLVKAVYKLYTGLNSH